ncbi:MAG: hypothetical protein N4A61_10410 [Pelagimonas sp.]|nr:hypothetical protein [Pelagimonas sp.]
MIRAAITAALAFAPLSVTAEGGFSLRDRLSGLQNRQIQQADPYADHVAADLARIDSVSEVLFDPEDEQQIVMFVTRVGCDPCLKAQQEYEDLTLELGLSGTVLYADTAPVKQIMRQLGLDMVPSYVMPDRMIRGHVPQFVLRRYLTE